MINLAISVVFILVAIAYRYSKHYTKQTMWILVFAAGANLLFFTMYMYKWAWELRHGDPFL